MRIANKAGHLTIVVVPVTIVVNMAVIVKNVTNHIAHFVVAAMNVIMEEINVVVIVVGPFLDYLRVGLIN